MPLIDTSLLTPDSRRNYQLDSFETMQVYCGLDSALTWEIWGTLREQYGSQSQGIYNFEKALMGPYLEIMQRGFRVDEISRRREAAELRGQDFQLREILEEYARAVWDRPLNPRSPKQLQEFFYGAMRLPEIWISQKGERKLSMNREVLEKLDQYLYARPFCQLILSIRDLAKQMEILEKEIDPDGRFRSSYNISGTETGRPSSSENAFGTGSNAQNIAPAMRHIFVADEGKKICVIDLEQVEARDVGFIVGNLFDDWKFLDNCESGDLHSNNCKLVWPTKPWTQDKKKNREIADGIFYRDFSFRDMSKRGGHLCLSYDHEVLTPSGWVPIWQKPEVIMEFDKSGSRFTQVLNWTDQEYSGDMILFEGNSVSALMTPNHRVPFIRDQGSWKDFYVQEAEKGPVGYLPLGWGWRGGEKKVPARLIAAFMSDGNQKSVGVMEFNLKKVRKIIRLIELCNKYGFQYNFASSGRIRIKGALPKRAGAFMFSWDRESIRDFIDEYKFWDGHISKTAVALFSTNKNHIEWIQTFGRICGIGGQIKHSVTRTNFGGTSKEYITDYYNLGQNHRKWATGNSINFFKIPAYKGRVYCPTVPSSFFYVRRNGKIFVTGNSNYYGTAFTMARSLKIPLAVAEEFQARYVRGGMIGGTWVEPAFPGIARWWEWTSRQLQTKHFIETPFGRRRHFFGRPNDDTTLREAIAFLPQSTTADRMNLGLWRVWRKMPQVELLAQTYDSITFQYDDRGHEYESQIISEALEHIKVELVANNGRRYVVPGEAKIGWNWGYETTQAQVDRAIASGKKPPRLNIEGLKKWNLQIPDTRQRRIGLDRLG